MDVARLRECGASSNDDDDGSCAGCQVLVGAIEICINLTVEELITS